MLRLDTLPNSASTAPASPVARALDAIQGSLWEWRSDGAFWAGDEVWVQLGCPLRDDPNRLYPIDDLVHPADAPGVTEAMRRCVNGHKCFDHAFRLRHQSRGYRWFEAWGSRTAVDESGLSYVSGAIRCVDELLAAAATECLQSKHELRRQRMQAIDCLASGIAHEFNNLLQAVCGYVEFVRKSLPHGSRERDDLSKALEAAGMATTLTRRLLEFSRAEGGAESRFELREMLLQFQDLLRVVTGQGVDLHVHPLEDAAHATGDETAFKQSLLNLLLNARDAMPSGGDVLIHADSLRVNEDSPLVLTGIKPGGYVRFLVNDTGQGVPRDVIDSIFDPFFTTKTATGGTGLGLSVAHGVMQRFGGTITVASEAERGTSFSLYLPAQSEAPVQRNRVSARVLHYCESPVHREHGARVLSDAGLGVLSCDSAAAFKGLLNDNGGFVDAVVIEMDHGVSGLDALLSDVAGISPHPPVLIATPLLMQAQSMIQSLASDLQTTVIPHPYDSRQIAALMGAIQASSGVASR